VDPRFVEVLGATGQEQGSRRWFERVHPDNVATTMRAWRESSAGAKKFRLEYRLFVNDDTLRWFAVLARPVLGQDGQPRCWVGTIDDIHDVVQTRAALQGEQLRLAKNGGPFAQHAALVSSGS
jgi:PAS domain S-box-containing protein